MEASMLAGLNPLAHLVVQTEAMMKPPRRARRVADSILDSIQQDLLDGYSVRQVAQRNGVSHLVVLRERRDLGMPPGRGGWPRGARRKAS